MHIIYLHKYIYNIDAYGQVTFVSRVVDADEYDAAAAARPHDCPLLAAGDLRSGRQAEPPPDHLRTHARAQTHTDTHSSPPPPPFSATPFVPLAAPAESNAGR